MADIIAENEKRRAEGAREERGAVVRWLREGLASSYPNGSTSRSTVFAAADAIEAEEHRKEAKNG